MHGATHSRDSDFKTNLKKMMEAPQADAHTQFQKQLAIVFISETKGFKTNSTSEAKATAPMACLNKNAQATSI